MDAFTLSSFYTTYVVLPNEHTVLSPCISDDLKVFPFFDGCLGAIDGTHVKARVPADDAKRFHDRKGNITFNHLVACSMDMYFVYVCAGWEGSAADGRVYLNAHMTDFSVPASKWYLADAGFPSCNTLLVPYRNQQYHLREWM